MKGQLKQLPSRQPELSISADNGIDKTLLVSLLKNFAAIPMTIEGDAFGKIYEYFLSEFAMAEGQRGGEFFTPMSIVKLIVEIIEPSHGKILDPPCGSRDSTYAIKKFFRSIWAANSSSVKNRHDVKSNSRRSHSGPTG